MGGVIAKVKAMDPDDVFAYSTLKIVTIRDRRLGILHYLLQLGIFIYIIVYTIIIQQRYLKAETPIGNIRATLREPSPWVNAQALPYCRQLQATYNNRRNYDCAYMLGKDAQYPPAATDTIFVTTRLKDTYYSYPSNCSSISLTGVPTDIQCAPSSVAVAENRYYIGNIEKYTVFIEHAVYGQVTGITSTNQKLKGELLYSGDKDKKVLLEAGGQYRIGTGDVFPVEMLLEAAGVNSLDTESSTDPANSKRYDGVFMIVVVDYSNRASNSAELKYKYSLMVLPGVDVIAMEPSANVNNTVFARSRYGLRFMFIIAGSIGVFDFPALLTSVVNGLVLLKVATTIVDLLLLYAMPDKTTYKKHKFELTEDFSDLRNKRHSTHPGGDGEGAGEELSEK